jgi:hypothetical protein
MERYSLPSISIFNKDMELLNVIKNLTSLTLTRNFFYPGTFGFELPFNSTILSQLEDDDNFVVFDDGNIGLINDIKDSEKQQNGIKEQFTIQGNLGLSLLNSRTVFPTTGNEYDAITDNVETVMKHYVANCITAPTDANRTISNFEIEIDKSLGDEIYYQMRYENLSEINNLAYAYSLGHNIYFDKISKKLKYDVFSGTDRSVSQSVNERVIFSKDFGNVSEQGYAVSKKNYKNYGIIGGSGDGVDRIIDEVGTATGWNRKEIFIDASSYDSDKLEDYGTEQLTKYEKAISLPVSIRSIKGTATEYRVKWNLGDIVTINSKKYNKQLDLRVSEVTENYSSNGFELNAVFGDPEPTLSDALKRKFEEFEQLKTA